MDGDEGSPWLMRLAKAVAGTGGDHVSAATPEDEYLQRMNPIDALKLRVQLANKRRYSPEEAAANRKQTLTDIGYITPIIGNIMSGMDVPKFAKDAATNPDAHEARKSALFTELSALGAITGLPFGQIAKNAARGARDALFSGAAPVRRPNEVTVYHGTADEFERFDPVHFGRRTDGREFGERPGRRTEKAFSFSDDPRLASEYAEHAQRELSSQGLDPYKMRNAYQASLNEQGYMNPEIYAREQQKLLDENFKSGARVLKGSMNTEGMKTVDLSGYRWTSDEGAKLRKALNEARKQGHTGLIVKGMEDASGSTSTQYLTWTPGTVRSAISDNELFGVVPFYPSGAALRPGGHE